MSKYTTEVRFICENYAGLSESEGGNSVQTILEKSHGKVFDFDYPIFDKSYKSGLEIKILRHFYTREICAETVSRWKLFLCDKMNRIMPYYNQLYNSELQKILPFVTTEMTTTHEGRNSKLGSSEETSGGSTSGTSKDTISKSDNHQTSTVFENKDVTDTSNSETGTETGTETRNTESTNTSTGTNQSKSLYSDTPQGAITDLASSTYLTNATMNDSNDNVNGSGSESVSGSNSKNTSKTGTGKESKTGEGTQEVQVVGTNDETINRTNEETRNDSVNKNFSEDGSDNFTDKVTGFTGNQSEMLLKFRETFLNIDEMVIHEFDDLFMGIY